jgi:hypothetical protein
MYRLEVFEKELKSTGRGKEILTIIMQHVEEVINLINHNRAVKVTWQRYKGPMFFADFMGSGFNKDTEIKEQIGDITFLSLIRHMAVVLQDNGSILLKRAIDNYYLIVMQHAKACKSLHQIFEKIRNNE